MNLRLSLRIIPAVALLAMAALTTGNAAPPAPPGDHAARLSPRERAMKMSEVPSIWVRLGVEVTAQNLENYIETPLRPAISRLLSVQVPTYWASANRNDTSGEIASFFNDGKTYTQLGIEWEGLSPENQKALLRLLPKELNHRGIGRHYTEGRGQVVGTSIVDRVRADPSTGLYGVWESLPGRPECVRLFLPTRANQSAGEVADAWLKLTENFTTQEPYRFQKPTRDAMTETLEDVERKRSHLGDFAACVGRGLFGK